MVYRRKTTYRPTNKSKYHAQKTVVDGITFDSKKEARRYVFLKGKEKAGLITGLELQKKFLLVPEKREEDYRDYSKSKGGRLVKGKVIEYEVAYYADFYYFDCMTQEWIVEDTKGVRTPEYIIKRKLLLWLKGIRIHEI